MISAYHFLFSDNDISRPQRISISHLIFFKRLNIHPDMVFLTFVAITIHKSARYIDAIEYDLAFLFIKSANPTFEVTPSIAVIAILKAMPYDVSGIKKYL